MHVSDSPVSAAQTGGGCRGVDLVNSSTAGTTVKDSVWLAQVHHYAAVML
jgi:hypothetical protein